VGRDRQLQTIIDAGEASAGEDRAGLVAVVGDAGAGKSRLLWEYYKYLDGIEDVRFYNHGRCLSYGEGVAYWALAEMIRSRAGITEEEPPHSARQKLSEAVAAFVSDPRERRLVEPRLAHLLRLQERPEADRADLFSGWRLFFERMADTQPVILAFEDLQWADSGLLDFIDYLLEWSADSSIFVIALGRPELRQRRPGWDLVVLEPLPFESVGAILEGLAPGLPPELVEEITRRAEGIPLYVVETIRMLLDRGLLVQEGTRYVVTGDVSDLDVPETLQALVASRLDGLSAAERALLQDASVLGQSFTASAAAALSGRYESEVVTVLDGLVAKQVLARDDDPRSPERGQYVFLQALLRTVAYGTLSRRGRKARHVAAAQHLERAWPGEARDIAEVLASHYQAAIAADPEAEDVVSLRAMARQTLTDAGRAAASLALGPEAQRYLEQAAELTDTDLQRAQLLEEAGRALLQSGDQQAAEQRLRQAIELHERAGSSLGGPAIIALAEVMVYSGRMHEARELLERFRSPEAVGLDPVTRADGLAQLAVVQIHGGALEDGGALIEEALTVLEAERPWPSLASGLITRAVYLILTHRYEEGYGVLQHALRIAEEHDLSRVALRARFNLAAISIEAARLTEAVDGLAAGLVRARERGDRHRERQLLGQQIAPLVVLGRWEEAGIVGATLLEGELDADTMSAAAYMTVVATARGDDELLARCLALAEQRLQSESVDQRSCAVLTFARAACERGDTGEVRQLVNELLTQRTLAAEFLEEACAVSIEAAIAAGDEPAMSEREQHLAGIRPARNNALLQANAARLRAELAHRRGDEGLAEREAAEAEALLRHVGALPRLGEALLERARRTGDADALGEARAIYGDLGAGRWLARIDQEFEVAA
jgi:tetratricopeptide (TPR) repeat protein